VIILLFGIPMVNLIAKIVIKDVIAISDIYYKN